ncbi:hypothetical protein Pres01_06770 [Metapseudomonas resinovorans]|uniref:DUF2784 domain-containing protein n=1 Tax=Metapseudomonas resinovorans TaxID=53412 RepID=UPI0009876510|nr:DUF2784 domain-containing protein [Pseudomonas resinovorans]GLZ84626.1 hypothetical protein Pres01_06770 [Pseudomonas resinovorans]
MSYRIAADAVLLLHLAFILFVVTGGLLVLKWPRLALVHLPAVAWGATVEFFHLICPLTPLENRLRRAAGEQGYSGGFIEHYLVPMIYPAGLTPAIQLWIGAFVLLLNLVPYGLLAMRLMRRR